MRRRLSLAGQFLVLQLVIVLLVVIAVTGVSLAQANIAFRNTEGARLRSLAETIAATDAVRLGLVDASARGALATIAENARGGSGASYVFIADEFRVLHTGPDAEQHLDLGTSTVLRGQAWVGDMGDDLVAHVPVLDSTGRLIGLVAAGRRYPTLVEQLGAALPNLLTYLVLGCLLGVGGSFLLARRIKRQTLGLEPREIIGLAEHREAMLHGIKEGVVGIDPDGKITLANDEAIRLLRLPPDPVGRPIGSLGLNRKLRSVLMGHSSGADQVVLFEDHVLVLNHTPISLRAVSLGSVTTLRDRTDMVAMQHELDVTRYATDALHAQARAFTTRLKAIAGFLDRHRYAEAARYAGQASRAYDKITEEIGVRIGDPGVAALLVAKASLAAAHGIDFQISRESRLPRLAGAFSVDVVTVLAALVDHALSAAGETEPAWIEASIQFGGNSVFVAVRDSASLGRAVAPGVAAAHNGAAWPSRLGSAHGWANPGLASPGSASPGPASPGHGDRGPGHPGPADFVSANGGTAQPDAPGLAAARMVCARRGGELGWHPEQGMTVWVPAGVGAP